MTKDNIVLLTCLTMSIMSGSLASDQLRAGLSIGQAAHTSKLKVMDTGQKEKFDNQDPSMGAFIGYDHLINETPLFIGLEAGINNQNSEKTKVTETTPPYSLKLKTNNSVLGALRLGVSAKDVLVYAKTGISSTNWQTTFKTPTDEKQTNFQKVGYVFGFGLECKMNHNFSFGLEHTFTKNNCLKNMHPEIDIKISPETHTTSMKLIYSF